MGIQANIAKNGQTIGPVRSLGPDDAPRASGLLRQHTGRPAVFAVCVRNEADDPAGRSFIPGHDAGLLFVHGTIIVGRVLSVLLRRVAPVAANETLEESKTCCSASSRTATASGVMAIRPGLNIAPGIGCFR